MLHWLTMSSLKEPQHGHDGSRPGAAQAPRYVRPSPPKVPGGGEGRQRRPGAASRPDRCGGKAPRTPWPAFVAGESAI